MRDKITPNKLPCEIPGCTNAQKTRGWCMMHYTRWIRHGDISIVAGSWDSRTKVPIQERFWAKVDKSGDCWLWTAMKSSSGYGKFDVGGRIVGAHRFAYELLLGPIPDALELDHLCRVRNCVNPKHLEPVTHSVNTLRGMSSAAINARKTECKHGHAFTSENIIWRSSGSRECRTCKLAWTQRRSERRRLARESK